MVTACLFQIDNIGPDQDVPSAQVAGECGRGLGAWAGWDPEGRMHLLEMAGRGAQSRRW